MHYFVTDAAGKSFRDIEWGNDVTHEEPNSNFFFQVYSSPLVAGFLYPFYELFRGDIQVWECKPEWIGPEPAYYPEVEAEIGKKINPWDDGVRQGFPKLTTLKTVPTAHPTEEQQITFAILCALNLVTHPDFTRWAITWIKNTDRSKETAKALQDKLVLELGDEHPDAGHDYLGSAFPALAAAYLDDVPFHAAAAGYRAKADNAVLSLTQIATIVSMLSADDIGNFLESQ
jgi:hypothetical protein